MTKRLAIALVSLSLLLLVALCGCRTAPKTEFATYDDILATYRRMADGEEISLDSQDTERERQILAALQAAVDSEYGTPGYCILDINADGVDELFLLDEGWTILALVTLRGGTPVVLDTYNGTTHTVAAVDEAGRIYSTRIGEGDERAYRVYEVANGELSLLSGFGRLAEADANADGLTCYRLADGEASFIYPHAYEAELDKFDEVVSGDWGEKGGCGLLVMRYIPITEAGYMPVNDHRGTSNFHTPAAARGTLDEKCRPVLYIEAWDEYITFPMEYRAADGYLSFGSHASAVAMRTAESGIFVAEPDEMVARLEVMRFEKGGKVGSAVTLDLPEDKRARDVFANFIDENTGYLTVISEYLGEDMSAAGDWEISSLWRTTDGGVTWSLVEGVESPHHTLKESAVFAKFLTPEIGVVAGRWYGYSDHLSGYTYITYDGGATWEKLPLLPFPESYEAGHYTELVDIERKGDVFVMTVGVEHDGIPDGERERFTCTFTSRDLRTWVFAGESREEDVAALSPFADYESIGVLYRQLATFCALYYNAEERDAVYEAYVEGLRFATAEERQWCDGLAASVWLSRSTYEKHDHGYTVEDINGDGVEEMILTVGNDRMVAIFTMVDGRPMLLERFWERKSGRVTADGLVYISESNGATDGVQRYYRIAEDCLSLELVREYGYETGADGTVHYYRMEDGVRTEMTAEEYLSRPANQFLSLVRTDPWAEYVTFRDNYHNPIDGWYATAMAEGDISPHLIMADYMRFWRSERALLTARMETVYADKDAYAAWATAMDAWEEDVLADCRISQNAAFESGGTQGKAEAGLPFTKIIRNRVIELEFDYYLATGDYGYGAPPAEEEPIRPDAALAAIFSEVLSGERLVRESRDGDCLLGDCGDYYGQFVSSWGTSAQGAYADLDGDGQAEMILSGVGEYILRYDRATDTVFAYYISPRSSYLYYTCGEIAINTEYDIPRIRLEFDGEDLREVSIPYESEAPSRHRLEFWPVEICDPRGPGK